MHKVLLLGALLCTSCLRDTSFHCATSAECGAGGTCQPGVGYCSIVDTNCASGARFGSSAGSYANQCVGGGADIDAPTGDGPMGDGPPADAPVTGCPAGYNTITGGQATHKYRLVATGENWQTQRAFCTATTSSAYLAIPDDQAELAALATLSGAAESWVGLSDSQNEGTWVTVKNMQATFLPWDTGEPNNGPPAEDCAAIFTSTAKLRDERCGNKYVAVCECEP